MIKDYSGRRDGGDATTVAKIPYKLRDMYTRYCLSNR